MSGKQRASTTHSLEVQWPARGSVATFIKCLHLLDLDLLDDWPGITEQTFTTRTSQQNMQLRIKGVEWSLYRLFELYSSGETRDKLRPFFPPLTALQSMNLRAALLRALTEMKKSGLIGRDIVLRKTMLDECKGERFEDMLSSFATVTLRKVAGSSVVPLILAHRHSLQRTLEYRQRIQYESHLRQEQLDEQAKLLSQRRSQALRQQDCPNSGDLSQATETLKKEWIGDRRWVNAILYEGSAQHGQNTQQLPAFSPVPPDGQTTYVSESLISDLNNRVQIQKDRLTRWRAFQESLPKVRTRSDFDERPVQATGIPLVSLNKHQSIVPNEKASETHVCQHSESGDVMTGPFAALLRSMERELSAKCTDHQRNVEVSQSSVETAPIQAGDDVVEAQRQFPSGTERQEAANTSRPVLQDIPSSPPHFPINSGGEHGISSKLSWLGDSQLSSESSVFQDLYNQPTHTQSLEERTKQSMAVIFSSDVDPSSPLYSLPSRSNIGETTGNENFTVDTANRLGTLMDRTRQSMAGATGWPSARVAKPKPRGDRASQLYPINQFETPQKQDPRSSILEPSSNGSTPREKLFSEDAEYLSVFKSRPKIAQSPMLSPDRSAVGDSLLAQEMTILNIGSDPVVYSSE